MRGHRTGTSDAGPVYVSEKIFLGMGFYFRQNIRPVSPSCKDVRREWGVRFGTFCFGLRRTLRVYKNEPPNYRKDPL